LHTHGTLATATAENAAWLTDHLRTHHPAVDPFSQSVFGWHFHFSLPEPGDGAPDAPTSTRTQVVVVTGLPSWDAFTRLQEPQLSRAWHDALVVSRTLSPDRGRDAHRGARGFFADFAPDMPLPVRLGVSRC